VQVGTAYRCRACPGEQQHAVLSRTFGCARVAWNRTLAARQARWHAERRRTSHAEAGQLEYKCRRYGRDLVVIDRWYPSSKTCSACGHLLTGLSLSTRHWTCPSCRARHDRDINAAKNILAAGHAGARSFRAMPAEAM
jgi:transposase